MRSVAAGAAQVAWIGAQPAIVQRYDFQQPAMPACGPAVLLSAVAAGRDRPLWPARPGPQSVGAGPSDRGARPGAGRPW